MERFEEFIWKMRRKGKDRIYFRNGVGKNFVATSCKVSYAIFSSLKFY